jgi:acyl carrier protein
MLGVGAVAHDDHFFSIGGDSLSAVQMMLEVETRFGLVLPVHLAFEAPTLEALAGRIDRAREPLDDEAGSGFVYPLVNQGTGAPLFFSGVELSLARRGVWAAPCPLYAIANWAMGSGIVQAESLQALAAQHVAAIRRIQPHGPYRLAGFRWGPDRVRDGAAVARVGSEVEFCSCSAVPPTAWMSGCTGIGVARSAGAGAVIRRAAASTPPESGGTDPLGRRIARHVRQFRAGPAIGDARWAGQMLMLHRLSPVIEWLYYLAVNHYLRHPNAASRLRFRGPLACVRFAAQRMVRHYRPGPTRAACESSSAGRTRVVRSGTR